MLDFGLRVSHAGGVANSLFLRKPCEEHMIIRRFRIGDEIALFRVFYSAIHDIASHDYTRDQVDAWAPADLDQKMWAEHVRDLRPFVAEIDGEIVGYADIQPSGYIDHFFVSGTHPRQGIGSLLMKRIHEEAKLLDIVELTSDVSKTAETFFVSHGFHVVQRKFSICRGVTLQNAFMYKNLKCGA
ncbi:GNAT family N-acetyltransferase [Pseudomonas putida]|jgi:putative acetyltransferase|uniref:GNAT family N-acetyltransferase n=1 Tax=Pseudomonas TaxID=286 RepID=UPI001E477DD4|nr:MULTISPECIES: GNAT family N-acetyltransferase [Pseudomonas]MCE1051255.1 GNAT family N-acetyltransferase [Pseudomonas alloputida]MCF1249965.1 GNAT family N-acetyltransferase [Pseudomonas putida]